MEDGERICRPPMEVEDWKTRVREPNCEAKKERQDWTVRFAEGDVDRGKLTSVCPTIFTPPVF